ncbi:MAG: hypothetical protein ACTSVI_05610 [Promethearchaeota archaeon]
MNEPPIILADWDEEKGPLIIDSLFPDNSEIIDDSPEVLITRCYISAQSIFARVEFSKINFNIPMVGIKKLAIVFFDVVEDASVRGNKRPFILVIFAPLDTNYGLIEPIQDIITPFLEEYKQDKIPDLKKLQLKVMEILGGTSPGVETKQPLTTTHSRVDEKELKNESPEIPTARFKTRTIKPSTSSFKQTIQDASYLNIDKKLFSIRAGAWTKEEIEKLKELKKKNMSDREVAHELHRTLKDVKEKINNLRI